MQMDYKKAVLSGDQFTNQLFGGVEILGRTLACDNSSCLGLQV